MSQDGDPGVLMAVWNKGLGADDMTLTVAVTGGIGAGKSTVAARFASHGAVLIDSDRLAREVVAPGSAGLDAVVHTFGEQVRAADGSLDRGALATIVFSDPDARKQLEGITHPRVRARFEELRSAAPADAIVVNDIPLLVTLQMSATFALVIGVHVDSELRVQRLVSRGLSESDARARIAAQIPDTARELLCDVWIPNNAGPEQLAAAADSVWFERLVPMRDNILAGRPATRADPSAAPPERTRPADAARIRERISAAADGRRVEDIGPASEPRGPGVDTIDLQLTVSSAVEARELGGPLAAIGFPAAVASVPVQASEQVFLHASADPARPVNLYLRVRPSLERREPSGS